MVLLKDVFSGWNKTQLYGFTQYAKDHPNYYTDGVHKGWDFGEPIGRLILSAHSGLVVRVDKRKRYNKKGIEIGKGLLVSIWDKKQGIATRYCHMSEIIVGVGEYVNSRAPIGYVGNTGFSKGSHLHFEIMRTDTRGYVLDKDNIYDGTIDPGDNKLVRWIS